MRGACAGAPHPQVYLRGPPQVRERGVRARRLQAGLQLPQGGQGEGLQHLQRRERKACTLLPPLQSLEAVDVCHKVLKQFPDYPRIKAEVLDRARAMIRP